MTTYYLNRSISAGEGINNPTLTSGSIVYLYSGVEAQRIPGYVCVTISMNTLPFFYIPFDSIS